MLIAPGPELVFATLACFKAGVKFVPVHSRWSPEQIEQVRSRTDANIALCDREFQALLQGSDLAPVIVDELEPPLPGGEPLVASPIETGHIYFTSGSTGRPKAVVGSHAGLCKFIDWQRASFWGAPGERASLLTAATFDPFLRDVFLPRYQYWCYIDRVHADQRVLSFRADSSIDATDMCAARVSVCLNRTVSRCLRSSFGGRGRGRSEADVSWGFVWLVEVSL